MQVSCCPGNAAIHDLQLSQLRMNSFKVLSQPTPICSFDFTGKEKISSYKTVDNFLHLIGEGFPNTIFFWWEIKMCYDDEPVLSCAPHWAHPDREKYEKICKTPDEICNLIPWRDHWMQGCFHIKSNRVYKINEMFQLKSSHDEFSWWFDSELTMSREQKPSCSCLFHITNSRNRIMQINNTQRRKIFQELLDSIEECENVDKILFVGDNNFLPLQMSPTTSRKILLLQENSLCMKNMRNFIDHNKSSIQLVDSLSGHEKISRIISEPHFDAAILPWDNIVKLWHFVEMYRKQNVNVQIHPRSATIYAIPVHFLHLYKIRWPLKSTCEGFNHKTFDEVIDFASTLADENVEPFSLWEYPCKALGTSKAIFNVNFINDKVIGKHHQTKLEIERISDEVCNGVAFWIEWEIDENKILACGPVQNTLKIGDSIEWKMEERQAVHLIPSAKVDKIQSILIDIDENLTMDFTYFYNEKLD